MAILILGLVLCLLPGALPAQVNELPSSPSFLIIQDVRDLGRMIDHPGINSEASELVDAISPDGNWLFFSRSIVRNGVASNADVYLSRRDRSPTNLPHGSFKTSERLKGEINDEGNNFIGGITRDGRTIAVPSYGEIALSTFGTIHGSTIQQWGTPEVQDIDSFGTSSNLLSFCISPDGQTLVMSLGRDDSYGGSDLYQSTRRADGTWSAPRNLGPNINTAFNETGPTMSFDGQSLFFSSNRIGDDPDDGYGKYDLFESLQDSGGWGRARNMGPNINTGSNEQFFVMDSLRTEAYFSSDRPGGYGSDDIYRATIAKHTRASATETDTGLTFTGKIYDAVTKMPVDARFEFELQPSNILVAADSSDQYGTFHIKLPYLARYDMRITADGHFPVTESVGVSRFEQNKTITRDIALRPLADADRQRSASAGAGIQLEGISFETGSATLTGDSRPALEAVAQLLAERPTLRIEIRGHTDNVGNREANRLLSLARAEAVVRYLVEAGVEHNRLIAKGYGETRPVASNRNERGRESNRRVEFHILQ